MANLDFEPIGPNRLRFVFDDEVVSLDLSAHPTLGDVARAYEALRLGAGDGPIGIDVRLAARSKAKRPIIGGIPMSRRLPGSLSVRDLMPSYS